MVRGKKNRAAPVGGGGALLLPFLLLLGKDTLLNGADAVQCPTLQWSDEFDGTALDTNKWEPMIGDGCDIGICGWGNNELQYYRAENAVVEGGTLKIIARDDVRVRNKQYTSARLRTKGKAGAEILHGRFEARIKIPFGQGLWPAFWMLPSNEVLGGWPQSGEIDIMENIGREPSTVHGTIHYGQPWPGNSYTGGSLHLLGGEEFHTNFHEFAIDKLPNKIRWSVDGYEYSVKTPVDTAPEFWPFDETDELYHFLLNVAIGGNWPGSPDSSTVFPQTMEVDYVRVYDSSPGKLVGPTQVHEGQVGVVFAVQDGIDDYSFVWSVPAGATIVENLGSSIKVNFQSNIIATGRVEVTATSSTCSTVPSKTFSVPVDITALPPSYGFEGHFVAPDAQPAGSEWATLLETAATPSGTYDSSFQDPLNSGRNLVVRYQRNAASQYDTIHYDVPDPAILYPSDYVTGTRKFFMDVYAPDLTNCVTDMLVQLESSAATPSNYPTGRHSRYIARLGSASMVGWQRIEFDFLDRPDNAVLDADTDVIIVLFDPDSFKGDLYYFDNFDSGVAGCTANCTVVDPKDCTPPSTSSTTTTQGPQTTTAATTTAACVTSNEQIDNQPCNNSNKGQCCSGSCSGGPPQNKVCA